MKETVKKETVKKEIETLIKEMKLGCSVEEFKDKIDWHYISCHQTLSEDFIREFQDKVDWRYISFNQTLSENFIREFQDKIDVELYRSIHQVKSLEQKREEISEYAKKHNLKFDGKYLYAFRNHNKRGCGIYHPNRSYEIGKYYRDWKCDMRKDVENSFGLGIFPKGNTKVKVKVEDWGLEVNRKDGKARVWGFEMI